MYSTKIFFIFLYFNEIFIYIIWAKLVIDKIFPNNEVLFNVLFIIIDYIWFVFFIYLETFLLI